MKNLFIVWGWSILVTGALIAGCQNPNSSGTIQINDEYNAGTCQFWVTLDGGSPVTLPNGGSYNYTSVSVGTHTIAYHTTGTSGSAGNCGFTTNGNTTASCSITVVGGVLYAANLTNDGNAAVFNYTCP